MKFKLLNDIKILNEYLTLYGHSAHRRRYLDRYPSQYFHNIKSKSKKSKKGIK